MRSLEHYKPAVLEAMTTPRLLSHLSPFPSFSLQPVWAELPLDPAGRLTYLRVVSVPPHVSEGAHLAGPQHCRCVDLFVLCGDKGKRQVYVLQGT